MKTKTEKSNGPPPVGTGERDCEECLKAVAAASPFKLERILVPVDFSECSKKALKYAVPFARQFHAEMIFLHILAVHYTAGWKFEVCGYPLYE